MREGFHFWQFIVIAVGIVLFNPVSAAAQRPPTVPINLSYLRIDFIQPGARSSALGGAFIGAAVDETAAAINPAGLVYLKNAGASLHQRQARMKYKEPEGSLELPNLKRNFHFNNFDQSLVTVFLPSKKITFALFRQVVFDVRYNFETRQFLTTDSNLDDRFLLGGLGNFPGRKVALDLEMVHDAFAFGFSFSKRLSLGIAVKTSSLNFKLHEQVFLNPLIASSTAPPDNSGEATYSVTTVDERATGLACIFGVLGKIIVDKLFAGAVLNLNPAFKLQSDIFLPLYQLGSQTLEAIRLRNQQFKLSVPDTYGLGLYYIANTRLRFTFDLIRIDYSDILSGNDLNVVVDDEPDAGGVFVDPDNQDDLQLDDAFEIHAGSEWLFKIPKLGLVPLRFGFYTNPGHRIHAANRDPDLNRLFSKPRDRVHFTFGMGIVLTGYLKFDGSIDFSEDGFQLNGSTLLTVQ